MNSDNSENNKPGYITANPQNYLIIKGIRDKLKRKPTKAEELIWFYLKNKKTGFKIRRQHIIDNFIVDFVCLSKKVVIEIDWKIHLIQMDYDEARSSRLNELNFKVIRFDNEEVYLNPEKVANEIKEVLQNR